MLDAKDFSFFEEQNSFDFKGFLIKTGSYWRWFVLGLTICLIVAYQANLRKQKIYSLETTIAIQEQDNPLFTSNTSLIFNWGGTSDQVQNIATTLRSRSHNEIVVDRLQFYIEYLQDMEYFTADVYGSTPFVVNIDKTKNQLAGVPINIKLISPTEYEMLINFTSNSATVYNYSNNTASQVTVPMGEYRRKFKVGERINLPFLNWNFEVVKNDRDYTNENYKVVFSSFDGTVSRYKNIRVGIDDKAASILRLSFDSTNKARIVDYLNMTVKTLIKRQLDNKNLFAENTIKYIDTTLSVMENDMKDVNSQLKNFSRNKNLSEIDKGGETFQTQMLELDVKNDEIQRKLNYYNTLNNYLRNSTDYSKLPAPSVAGIDDPNILSNVSNLIGLSVRRSEIAYSVKGDKMFKTIDNEISSLKNVLLENIISAKSAIQFESRQVNNKIGQAENKIAQLPEDKQEFLRIMRKYNLSENIYQTYLQKRSEAQIVMAANLSDIQFIDPAKDIGDGLIGPKTNVNYIIAIFVGILVPLIVVFLLFFINNQVQNTDDIQKATQIPLIGVVGLKHNDTNLSVFEKPKSALSESFRAIRSSLQFLYKKQHIDGAKTLMLTSSVSGEGKTFCSINIATVFALSEKKTVIVGFDLRKPKIFDDFNITNEIGVVNYLIGQKTLDDIIFRTHIPHLDVITSGPVPPNPSELIMSDAMDEFMAELKRRYDYIILDTPPVGLVTDAIELSQYADLTLYIMRQNFTRKDMINLINNRVKRGELVNVSIILNGFQNKAKYGAGYGYGYGYGYGAYSNGYHEQDKPKNVLLKYFKKLQKRFKKGV